MAITGGAPPKRTTTPGGLRGFTLNTDDELHRIIANIQGLPKTGKNNLCFTAPGDIAVQSFDIGLEGVIEKFNKRKKIYTASYELKSQPGEAREEDVEVEAGKLWKLFTEDYYDALDTPGVRTVIWDQGTEVWELLRLSEWGKLSANSQHYAKINPKFRRLIREAYERKKNLLLIHKMKDEWKESTVTGKQSKTGKYEMAGMKEIPYLVQVCVQTWRDDTTPFPGNFHATITDCRQNAEVNGFEFAGDQCSIEQIGLMVFPDSIPEEWQ